MHKLNTKEFQRKKSRKKITTKKYKKKKGKKERLKDETSTNHDLQKTTGGVIFKNVTPLAKSIKH